jgi:hypothetical protein
MRSEIPSTPNNASDKTSFNMIFLYFIVAITINKILNNLLQ